MCAESPVSTFFFNPLKTFRSGIKHLVGDLHADLSTSFVSQLANGSVLIASEGTERGSLPVAHKVFPRATKHRVKI